MFAYPEEKTKTKKKSSERRLDISKYAAPKKTSRTLKSKSTKKVKDTLSMSEKALIKAQEAASKRQAKKRTVAQTRQSAPLAPVATRTRKSSTKSKKK
jgi:hypothetical protein